MTVDRMVSVVHPPSPTAAPEDGRQDVVVAVGVRVGSGGSGDAVAETG